VDQLSFLEKLLALGVTTIQLRLKDTDNAQLEKSMQEAIRTARRYGARLFINDYWQLAIKHGAYGVHLGQEDLASADMRAIIQAGLRVGMSTHAYSELARTKLYGPSYVAIGTVFPSPSKPDLPQTQGVEGFRKLSRLSSTPTVAIGGMHPEQAAEVLAAGADGIAVISDLTTCTNLGSRVQAWLKVFARSGN